MFFFITSVKRKGKIFLPNALKKYFKSPGRIFSSGTRTIKGNFSKQKILVIANYGGNVNIQSFGKQKGKILQSLVINHCNHIYETSDSASRKLTLFPSFSWFDMFVYFSMFVYIFTVHVFHRQKRNRYGIKYL